MKKRNLILGVLLIVLVIGVVIFSTSSDFFQGYLKLDRSQKNQLDSSELDIKLADSNNAEEDSSDISLEFGIEFTPSLGLCPSEEDLELIFYSSYWEIPDGLSVRDLTFDQFYASMQNELNANNGEVSCPYWIYLYEDRFDKEDGLNYMLICEDNDIEIVNDKVVCTKHLNSGVYEFYLEDHNNYNTSLLKIIHSGAPEGGLVEKHTIEDYRVERFAL